MQLSEEDGQVGDNFVNKKMESYLIFRVLFSLDRVEETEELFLRMKQSPLRYFYYGFTI